MATTGTPPVSKETVDAHISGDVSGRQIEGNHNVQLGSIYGSVVTIASAAERPQPRLRTSVAGLPRAHPDLVGRQAEVSLALVGLGEGEPVEFHGPAGIGKSALLRHLARHPELPVAERVVPQPTVPQQP